MEQHYFQTLLVKQIYSETDFIEDEILRYELASNLQLRENLQDFLTVKSLLDDQPIKSPDKSSERIIMKYSRDSSSITFCV